MFKIKCSKTKDQKTITINRDDNFDLSGNTLFDFRIYTDDLGDNVSAYVLTGQEIIDFIAGSVSIPMDDFIGADPDDDYYTVICEVDMNSFQSYPAGVSITLEATSEVFSNQGSISVYSPDYRLDNVLLTAFMLLHEMNMIEEMDSSKQKRADFTTRQALLKDILKY